MTSGTQENLWTAKQAYIMGVICLALGITVGFLARGPAAVQAGVPAVAAARAASRPAAPSLPDRSPSSSPMQAASAQAANPVLERLKADPKNFKLLVQAGEMFYHHGAYAEAAGYYQRALAVEDRFEVRNQYASALFYQGDADGALQQYAQVLRTHPGNDVALFNAGMVKLQAKNDPKGAVELWEKLLQSNPKHPQRQRVRQLIERAARQG